MRATWPSWVIKNNRIKIDIDYNFQTTSMNIEYLVRNTKLATTLFVKECKRAWRRRTTVVRGADCHSWNQDATTKRVGMMLLRMMIADCSHSGHSSPPRPKFHVIALYYCRLFIEVVYYLTNTITAHKENKMKLFLVWSCLHSFSATGAASCRIWFWFVSARYRVRKSD